MGVSSVFYVVLAAEKGAGDPRLFGAVTLIVAVSTVARRHRGRRPVAARTSAATASRELSHREQKPT